jgi:hypothetical protein
MDLKNLRWKKSWIVDSGENVLFQLVYPVPISCQKEHGVNIASNIYLLGMHLT